MAITTTTVLNHSSNQGFHPKEIISKGDRVVVEEEGARGGLELGETLGLQRPLKVSVSLQKRRIRRKDVLLFVLVLLWLISWLNAVISKRVAAQTI